MASLHIHRYNMHVRWQEEQMIFFSSCLLILYCGDLHDATPDFCFQQLQILRKRVRCAEYDLVPNLYLALHTDIIIALSSTCRFHKDIQKLWQEMLCFLGKSLMPENKYVFHRVRNINCGSFPRLLFKAQKVHLSLTFRDPSSSWKFGKSQFLGSFSILEEELQPTCSLI